MPRWGCPTCVPPTKEQTMTPLRARMIEDMKLGGLADKTQEVYQQAVRGLAKHYRRPPDQLSEAEVRRYLMDVKEQGAARGTFKTCHYGIQFFTGRRWAATGRCLKKDPTAQAEAAAAGPLACRGPADPRQRPQSDPEGLLCPDLCLRPADQRGCHTRSHRHRQSQPALADPRQGRQGTPRAAAEAGP